MGAAECGVVDPDPAVLHDRSRRHKVSRVVGADLAAPEEGHVAVDPVPVEAVAAAHQEHVPHLVVGLVDHQETDVELAAEPGREVLVLVIDPVVVVRRQHVAGAR